LDCERALRARAWKIFYILFGAQQFEAEESASHTFEYSDSRLALARCRLVVRQPALSTRETNRQRQTHVARDNKREETRARTQTQ
jgi:hypothetical protein